MRPTSPHASYGPVYVVLSGLYDHISEKSVRRHIFDERSPTTKPPFDDVVMTWHDEWCYALFDLDGDLCDVKNRIHVYVESVPSRP